MDIDALWDTYHHIAKLAELGEDERGNSWAQHTYGMVALSRWSGETETELSFIPAGELCGTRQCFAGWYATLRGLRMNGWGDVRDQDGTERHVSGWVSDDAGLSHDESSRLFHGENSLGEIRTALTDITGEDRG